jgi:DNA-binding HxlR family transcriptional regulator
MACALPWRDGGEKPPEVPGGPHSLRAPNTLSERLKALEAAGIVERRFYEQHPPRAEYVLTDKGRDLAPIVRAMRDWGMKYK